MSKIDEEIYRLSDSSKAIETVRFLRKAKRLPRYKKYSPKMRKLHIKLIDILQDIYTVDRTRNYKVRRVK